MYLFFPTLRLNLVSAVNCFSFLSQILDDAKVEFTVLKRSLEPADNGIPVKKHHLPVLSLKLNGCSKFPYDECLWASKQKNSKYFIERRDHQSNTSLAFAVFCCGRENVFQVGWIKEADKNTFRDFITGSAKLKDMSVICNKLKIRPEHKTVELEIKISNESSYIHTYSTVICF